VDDRVRDGDGGVAIGGEGGGGGMATTKGEGLREAQVTN
jgi:hypothetical protein